MTPAFTTATSPRSDTTSNLSPIRIGDADTDAFSNTLSAHTTLPVFASAQVTVPLSPIHSSRSPCGSTHGT